MKDKMTWEDTIISIRKEEEFKDLVEKAYFDENLQLNIERFGNSEEFSETLKLIYKNKSNTKSILDIGCGNGISAINFAIKGFDVTAVEPDPSNTVGAGAIRQLKSEYKLDNIDIYEAFAEDINFESNTFDVVYIRQAMHHANNLNQFVKECVRVLKPNGLLLTIRDHVIFNSEDKEWFLEKHPLHKFYGGENAFTSKEYINAIQKAGATILKELKYYDSIINYFPLSNQDIEKIRINQTIKQKQKLKNKLGIIYKLPFIWDIYKSVSRFNPLNEAATPGRMYSYIAIKK